VSVGCQDCAYREETEGCNSKCRNVQFIFFFFFLLHYLEIVKFLLKCLYFLLVGSTNNSEQKRLSCLLSSLQIKTNWEVWEPLSGRRHCKSMKFWSREKNIDSFTFLYFCFSPHFTFWSVQPKSWCGEGWKEFSALIASFIAVLFIQQIFLSMYYVPGSVLGLGVKWWSKSWWRKSSVHIWLFIQISPLLGSSLLKSQPRLTSSF